MTRMDNGAAGGRMPESGYDGNGVPPPAPLVPRYVAGLMPPVDAGKHLEQLTQPIKPFTPPLVVLVAWGSDTTYAALAAQRGSSYARQMRYRVRETFTSYGEPMRDALLFGVANSRFLDRNMDYSCAWWLVPHSAVSLRDMSVARTALQQAWIQDAADEGQFLRPSNLGTNAAGMREALPLSAQEDGE